MRLKTWLLALAGLAVLLVPTKGNAATTQTVDIHVSINAVKSLSVGATSYNYGSLAVNTSSVSSNIVVTNNSTSLVETYRIQGADAVSDTAGTNWTLAASTGTNQYALAAQFSTAQPANTDSAFSSDDLTTSAVTCSSTQFGNGVAGESGAAVSPVTNTTRNLWFRIRTPDVITDPTPHTISVTLSIL